MAAQASIFQHQATESMIHCQGLHEKCHAINKIQMDGADGAGGGRVFDCSRECTRKMSQHFIKQI